MGLGKRIASMFVEITATPNKLRADLTRASSMIRDWSLVAEGFGGTVAGAFEAVATIGLQAITIGTAAAIAGFALATIESAKFEDAMVRTFTILGKGFDLTNSSIKDLTDTARLLGRDTLFSATQAAEGMQILARSGFNAYEVIRTIRPVLNMAIVGNMEMAQSANIAVAALRSFQLAASDAGRVANVLSVLMSRANTDIEMAGTALSYVGAVAHGAGLSLEETGAAIGILSDAGISASKAGTTLRRVIAQLQAPSGRAQKIFEKLGVTFTDATGDLKPFVQIIGDLQAAGMSAAQAMQAFGLRGGPGMQALLGRGAGALQRLQTELEDSTGAAERMAQKFRTTIMGRTKDLQASLVDLGLALTKDLQKPMADVIFGFRNFIKSVVEAGERTGAFKAIAEGLVVIMEPLVKLAEKLGEQFLNWFKTLKPEDIQKFFNEIAEQIEKLVGAGVNFGKDFITGFMDGIAGVNIADLLAEILDVGGDVAARMFASTVKGAEFLATAIEKISKGWDKLPKPIKDAFNFVTDMVGAVGLLFNYLAPIVNMFIALSSILVPLALLLGLVGTIMGGLSLKKVIEEGEIFQGLLEEFPQIWEVIKAGVDVLKDVLTIIFKFIDVQFNNLLLNMANAINKFLSGIPILTRIAFGLFPIQTQEIKENLADATEALIKAKKDLFQEPTEFRDFRGQKIPIGEMGSTQRFTETVRVAGEVQAAKGIINKAPIEASGFKKGETAQDRVRAWILQGSLLKDTSAENLELLKTLINNKKLNDMSVTELLKGAITHDRIQDAVLLQLKQESQKQAIQGTNPVVK